MKKCKSAILTLLLVSAIGTAAMGGVMLDRGITASATEYFTSTNVFSAASEATIGPEEDGSENLAFTFYSGSSVSYHKDLALKWYEAKGEAGYLNFKFSFKDISFETMTITVEAAPATANKDGKTVNKIVFTSTGTALTVKVVSDGEEDGAETAIADPTADFSFALSQTADEKAADKFAVNFAEGEGESKTIGFFENVGMNYAEYISSSPMVPLEIEAKMPDGAESTAQTTLFFKELNNQSFLLETEGDNKGKIRDNASPVLVVNDEINSFLLGTSFSLDYETLDVLDATVTKTMEYYQYNPTTVEEKEYSTLSTSTYFFETTYEKDDSSKTTVYGEDGMEYISVRFTLSDDVHTGDDAKTYYLDWYLEGNPVSPAGDAEGEYIPANRNDDGPQYYGISSAENADGEWETSISADGEARWEEYRQTVIDKAAETPAGSNSYLYLPSLRGLITDNDTGYKNLKFSIYYKTAGSDSVSSSTSLTYSNLRLAVSSAGEYEFKIVATDKAGNGMYAYIEGRRVVLGSDNIFDVEAIPSFRFSVRNQGLSIDDGSTTTETDGYIGVTYTASSFTVIGPSNTAEYALYYFDPVAFQQKYPGVGYTSDALSSVKFSEMKEQADLSQVTDDDYLGYYARLYATILSEKLGSTVTAEGLLDGDRPILRSIEEYDSSIDEDDFPDEWADSDNDYAWYPDSRSFKPQEAGVYIVLGVFTDSTVFSEKVAAYKAVGVEADTDVIKGETQWLQNNLVSVILFSISAVLAVAIVILLVVKPSDESLEDVDGDGSDKKGKKKRKAAEKADKAKNELDSLDKD